jgi:pimeloyl-ACP methyl ester carboxylesterase
MLSDLVTAASDVVVDNDGLKLATRDYGGSGLPVLLLHGAGRTLEDLSPLAARLLARHRVISMDLRCHGLSGDAPWTLDAATDDVLTVIRHFGIAPPVVVGHSLGGILAAILAERTGAIAAAVNLDGHGQGTPSQYPGMDEGCVSARLKELAALSQASALPSKIPASTALMLLDTALQNARSRDLPTPLVARAFARSLRMLPEGNVELRPSTDALIQLTAAVQHLNLLAGYARTTAPLLVYNCTEPPAPFGLPDWAPALFDSYRKGLARDLTALAGAHRLVHTRRFPAGHDLHLEQPQNLADEIECFLDQARQVGQRTRLDPRGPRDAHAWSGRTPQTNP